MGSHTSRQLDNETSLELSKQTGFSRRQIHRLHCRFCHLDKTKRGVLRRSDLEHISELHINPLGVRIIDAFFSGGRQDLSFPDFINVLAVFRPGQDSPSSPPPSSPSEQSSSNIQGGRVTSSGAAVINSRDEKIRFVFSMYDVNGDGVISKHELSKIFQMMVGVNVTAEQLQYVLELTLEEAHADESGDITFEKFKEVMENSSVEEKLSIRFFS